MTRREVGSHARQAQPRRAQRLAAPACCVLLLAVLGSSAANASASGVAMDAAALQVLTYNVFGHPLAAQWQRPRRFSQLSDELGGWLAGVHLVALQEAFVEDAQVLRRARPFVDAGACGAAGGYNPSGLLLLSDLSEAASRRAFAFVAVPGGNIRLVDEEELDCPELRRTRSTLKGALWVRYRTELGSLDVVNVHLAPSSRVRQAQIQALAALLAAHDDDVPRIVLGDWNEDVCQRGAPVGAGRAKLSARGETWASCGAGATVGGWRQGIWQGAFGTRQLDHVLTRGLWPGGPARRILHAPRAGGHLSDHDGVWVRLRWPASAAPALAVSP